MWPTLSVAVAILALVCTKVLRPTDETVKQKFKNSTDEDDMLMIGTYIEAVAVLARRGALDPSMLVDAVGLSIRQRGEMIRPDFEWLAMYSAWWKDVPRNPRQRNYKPAQFSDVVFRV